MLFACSEPCTLPARDSDNVSRLTAKSRSIACTFAQSLAPLQAYTLCSLTEIACDYSFCATSAQWGKRVVIKLTYLCSLHSVTSLSSTFGSAGPGDLPGLTDDDKPRMRGPKRASKIRKLFNLTKDDDVRKYVNTYRRSFEGKDGKTHSKAPKIQRLVTPLTLQRKRRRASLNRQRHEKVGMLCVVIMLGSGRILLLGKQTGFWSACPAPSCCPLHYFNVIQVFLLLRRGSTIPLQTHQRIFNICCCTAGTCRCRQSFAVH